MQTITATALVVVSTSVVAKRTPNILFVCRFGSVKSPVAREYFRRRAAERGLVFSVKSRGITPEAHISESLLVSLKRDGIDQDRDGLHKLRHYDLRQADILVIFDTLPSGLKGKNLHDWTNTGSFNESFATEKPKLLLRIDALIDEIISMN